MTVMTKVRLLVADDHAVVRQGIRQILAETPDFDIVREATDGVQVMEKLRGAQVDIVVLDLSMPMMSVPAPVLVRAPSPAMSSAQVEVCPAVTWTFAVVPVCRYMPAPAVVPAVPSTPIPT